MSIKNKQAVNHIVIVGGGSAGWLTAGLLACEHIGNSDSKVSVTLIESPDVKTIGVGEGTWPTMRSTLQKIGISETEFLQECSASFKQGTKFVDWVSGDQSDYYYHPFTLPAGYTDINLVPHWQPQKSKVSFVNAVSVQGHLCDNNLAPKLNTTPEYAYVANYAYHLDAGKFAELLQRHCTEKLGVKHVIDHVTDINGAVDENIRSVSTRLNGEIAGDLFIDCTGMASLLLGGHYQIPFVDLKPVLFNDTALAIQVPYAADDSAIASQTVSTAQSAGWIWDIGLSSRRGIGYTYSSSHSTDEQAELELRNYLARTCGTSADSIESRKISFKPGHREKFWHKNCVAVGMAAGFLEPLEASALVLVELAGQMISEDLPANDEVMDIIARRFNDKFLYRWDRIIDFLKLHYVLSKRSDSDYWLDNRNEEGIPDSLNELLALWQYHVPSRNDFPQSDEVFSAASYQYVLFGMGFETESRMSFRHSENADKAHQLFVENNRHANELVKSLPGNRDLLAKIDQYGLQKI
ncbi:MAG: tryptophan halogenase [Lysobacterales bacterium]|jgi:tryptophan halogenase